MGNKLIIVVVVILVIVVAGVLISRMEAPEIPDDEAATEAEVVAEEWVEKMAPTFVEREGEGLTHISTEEIEEGLFEIVLEFEAMFAGYGKVEEGEMAAQVITPHTTVVRVEGGEVVSAITDGVFDEHAGAMIEEEEEEETTRVDVYFVSVEDGQESLVSVEREVSTDNVERFTLLTLLDGPEMEENYTTAIEGGTTLNSLTVENGVARADFSEELDASGSATVTMIRDQIENTLLQFETIEEVVISIEGETEEILQP